MNHNIYQHEGHTWERISKGRARNLYERGETIGLAGCNANPESPWGLVCYESNFFGTPFDVLCNSAAHYQAPALGRTLAFYAKQNEPVASIKAAI
jgi:hypothetical protein